MSKREAEDSEEVNCIRERVSIKAGGKKERNTRKCPRGIRQKSVRRTTHLCVLDSKNGMRSAAGLMNMGGCCDPVHTRQDS